MICICLKIWYPAVLLNLLVEDHIFMRVANLRYVFSFLVIGFPAKMMNFHIFNGNFRILKWRYLPYIRPFFKAYFLGDIPLKYGQTYGTNVPPLISILNYQRVPRWHLWPAAVVGQQSRPAGLCSAYPASEFLSPKLKFSATNIYRSFTDHLWVSIIFRVSKHRWISSGKIPAINGWFGGTPILGNLHLQQWTRSSTGPDNITYSRSRLRPSRGNSSRKRSQELQNHTCKWVKRKR